MISGYEVKGHGGTGKYGEDILCAAVSALAQTAPLAILRIVGECLDIMHEPGRLKIDFRDNLTVPDRQKVDLICEAMFVGLQEIAKDYPNHMVIYRNSGGVIHVQNGFAVIRSQKRRRQFSKRSRQHWPSFRSKKS